MRFRQRRGLTYIEVMAALVIMILIFTFVTKLNGASNQSQHQDLIKMQMLLFAQGALEEAQYRYQTTGSIQLPSTINSNGSTSFPSLAASIQAASNTSGSPAGVTPVLIKVLQPGNPAGQKPVYLSGDLLLYP